MRKSLLILILIIAITTSPLSFTNAEMSEIVGYDFWLEFLEQNASRDAGTPEELQAANALENYYRLYNLEPYHMVNSNDYLVSFDFTFNNKEFTSQNVAGVLKSNNESAKSIIIGAHYDAVSNQEDIGIVAGDGAYDNASGLATMIQLIDRLSKIDLDLDVIFIAFGAEELGLFGSNWIVDNMSEEEIENTLLMINIDSIACGDYLYLYTDEVDNLQEDYMMGIAEDKNIDIKRVPKDKKASPYENQYTGYNYSHDFMYSDHAPFMKIGIDVAFFIGYNMEDFLMVRESETLSDIMHTSNDNVEYILDVYGADFVKNRINSVATIVESFISDSNFESIMLDSKVTKYNYRWMTNSTVTMVIEYVVKGFAIIGLFLIGYSLRKKYSFNVDVAFPKEQEKPDEDKFIFEDLKI